MSELGEIQLYYGVKDNDNQHEWYICQDKVHYACIIQNGKQYTIDHDESGTVYPSLREAAETYGTITNNLLLQYLDKVWCNTLYQWYWAIYAWIEYRLNRKD